MRETPSQTAGPYLHIGMLPEQAGVAYRPLGSNTLTGAGTPIVIEGRVLDGIGAPCRDMVIELWQADADGHYGGVFRGWARSGTDFATGVFRFTTIRPGAIAGAPFVSLWLAARGLNIGLQTRMYFPNEPRNDADPVLSRVEPLRRPTLIAGAEAGRFVFDIHLQGPQETVFFDV